jgi:hypothetical protein
MAKFSNGIFSGVTGTVGNFVGYKMNGEFFMRAKTSHVTNPRTAKQLAVRSRMKGAVKLACSLLNSLIHPVWKRHKMLSPYNCFVQANIQAFGSDGKVSDPSKLIFSKGNLQIPEGLTAATVVGEVGKVVLNWIPDVESRYASMDDRLMVVAFFNDEAVVLEGLTATRNAGTATLSVPFASGCKVYFYAFFLDKVGEHCSKDVMIQVILS